MQTELQLLIEELQREHDYLENEMNICIKERWFLEAEGFNKALFNTANKLIVLKNLANPNYDKIIELKRRIEIIKNLELHDWISTHTANRMKATLPELEAAVSRLETETSPPTIDSDALRISLNKILRDEIQGFRIEVEGGKFSIAIERYETGICVEVSRTDRYTLLQSVSRMGISELTRCGFTMSENSAVLVLENFDKSKIPSTIEILSRTVYEVLRLYGNRKGSITYKT